MADQSLAQWWEDFLAYFMSNPQANMSSIDVNQAVLDAGYDPADLGSLDHGAIYEAACGRPGTLPEYKTAPPPVNPNHETVVRQITQVSEVHNYNTQIIDQSNQTIIDQSFDVGGDFSPTGDFDFNPVAADDGSVAGGNDAVGATGEGSAATGEGNAAASGGVNLDQSNNLDVDLGFGRGLSEDPGGASPLTRVLEPNGGGGGGLFPDRPDVNINTGGGNQTVVDGPNSGIVGGGFGDGADLQNITGPVTDSQISDEGTAAELDGNTVSDGSALGNFGGNQSGHSEDEFDTNLGITLGDNSPLDQHTDGDEQEEPQPEEAIAPA